MDALFLTVATGTPRQPVQVRDVGAPAYMLLCAQAPKPEARIQLLQNRLLTSTETSAAQNISYLVNTCLSTSLSPDDVEPMIENVLRVAQMHHNWPDFIKWVCVLVHYFCTDDLTVSLFSEFDAPRVAVRALRDFPQQGPLILAANALLSHFHLYDIGDGITQLVKVLQLHSGDALISKMISHNLAEFTSYCKEIPERFIQACREFTTAGGIAAVESVLQDHVAEEDLVIDVARVVANVTSAGTRSDMVASAGSSSCVIEADAPLMKHLADALARYPASETLAVHVLRVFSNVPRSYYLDWNVVATLFTVTQSELVLIECIHYLSSVAMSVKELKPKIQATGCLTRVLEVMRGHAENSVIQEEACSLLSYLSYDSETITGTITELEGIQLVLRAMRRHAQNEDVLLAACAALSGLAFNNPVGQKIVLENDGVSIILDALRNGHKPKLHENGCLAIGTMCWNSELKAEVVRCGGVRVIMKSLEEHYTSAGLVKNACRALAQIVFNSDQYRDALSAEGAIPLIVRGMEQHPNYDRVQMHGCVALSYLCWTNESNAAQIATSRGYRVVVDAMRNHPNSHEVQEHACRALANISSASLEDAAAALEQIIAAMRRHERVSEVQEEACRAIVTLSLASPVNKDRLYELGGAEVVITAMHNFPRVQLVQQETCNALAHLAYEHPNLNRVVTELGGVELLLIAMRTHPASPKVQLNACGGLSALAFDNPVAQRQIFELDGVKCVIHAMDHFERLRMLELGCSVLGTLAWNTEIKERVAVEAVPEILKAMRVHESSPLLQKSTCRAISQFAFNSEKNRQLLAEAGAIPLIVHAMRVHLTTEKLVVHAVKALTYLCWENNQVAEAIIRENVEEVLQNIVVHYAHVQRVYNEAVHLSKILFRKTTNTPSSSMRYISPPVMSPMTIGQTPGIKLNLTYDAVAALSPPLHTDPEAGGYRGGYEYGLTETGSMAPSTAVSWSQQASNQPTPQSSMPASHPLPPPRRQQTYIDAAHDVLGHDWGDEVPGPQRRGGGRGRPPRNRRRGAGQAPTTTMTDPGSSTTAGHGGPASAVVGEEGATAGRRFGRRPPGHGAPPRDAADLWDDPDPDTCYGSRQPVQLNWQQAELSAQTAEAQRRGRFALHERTGDTEHGRARAGVARRGVGGRGGYRRSGGGGRSVTCHEDST